MWKDNGVYTNQRVVRFSTTSGMATILWIHVFSEFLFVHDTIGMRNRAPYYNINVGVSGTYLSWIVEAAK